MLENTTGLHIRLDLHDDLLQELSGLVGMARRAAAASLQVGLHLHDDLLQELSGLAGMARRAAASLQVGLHFHDDLLQELSGLAESGGIWTASLLQTRFLARSRHRLVWSGVSAEGVGSGRANGSFGRRHVEHGRDAHGQMFGLDSTADIRASDPERRLWAGRLGLRLPSAPRSDVADPLRHRECAKGDPATR
jgi:hypothetical protein